MARMAIPIPVLVKKRSRTFLPGSYTIQWTPAAGYAAEAVQPFQLTENQTLVLTKIMLPLASGPARDIALCAAVPARAVNLRNGDSTPTLMARLTWPTWCYDRGRYAPSAPATPSPANGAANVRFTAPMTLSACTETRTYDLFLLERWRGRRRRSRPSPA